MQLKASRIYEATPVLATIIRENRPMPLKGKYRLARLHTKLLPEYQTLDAQRNQIIASFGFKNDAGVDQVPEDKLPEFWARWKEITDEDIEVAVEPLSCDDIDSGTSDGAVTAAELQALGELVGD